MKIPGKIVFKTKLERIRSQQFRESFGLKVINEWVDKKKENGTNI